MQEDLGSIGLQIETIGYDQVMDNLDRLLRKRDEVRGAFAEPARSMTIAAQRSGAGGIATEFGQISAVGQDVSKSLRTVLGRSFDLFLKGGADAKTLLRSLEKEALAFGAAAFTGKRAPKSTDLFSSLFSGAGDFLSTAFTGFASGGSFQVGGAAGRDRNLVGLRLSRGEEVSIKTPAQQRQSANAQQAGGNFTFNFQISTPDADSFRRSQSQLQAEALKSARRVLGRNG